ncbi:kinase-like domain-containing protein [Coprinopsis sp. MPI-PUGE-AT-0042]|nr:kinase-like domain-containing protein [Coprinopsis sp. MPI-PUGE-AT-0042]
MATFPRPEYEFIDDEIEPIRRTCGGYSTVWLARDTQQEQYVAVKVCTADSLPNEMQIIRDLAASSPAHPGHHSLPVLLDEFTLVGPNGTHTCYTTLPAQANLRDISFNGLFTLPVARALSAGLVQAISYVHSRGYVHGDVNLNNVLIPLPAGFQQLSMDEFLKKYDKPETQPLPPNIPKEVVVPLYMGDKAEKMAHAPRQKSALGKKCHTPLASQPPEARFPAEAPLSYSADIWSLAIAIWDIVGMQPVFCGEFSTEDDMTAFQIDTLGPMPRTWWDSWESRPKYFDADLMGQMLVFRPEHRPTCEEVLKSEWMVKWALPELRRAEAASEL